MGTVHGFVYSDGTYSSVVSPDGSSPNSATGINNRGQVLVEADGGNYLFANGNFTQLNLPASASPYGISNSGDVVGTLFSASSFQQSAFLYKNGVLTTLPFGTALGAADAPIAFSVNNADQIVGYNSVRGAFLYSDGTFTNLVVPGAYGGDSAVARAINRFRRNCRLLLWRARY